MTLHLQTQPCGNRSGTCIPGRFLLRAAGRYGIVWLKGVFTVSKKAVAVIKKVVAVAVVLILCVGAYLYFPAKTEVERTLTVPVYTDGVRTGETTVEIRGTVADYRTDRDGVDAVFAGTFAVGAVKRSCIDGVVARLTWYHGTDYVSLLFMFAGGAWDCGTETLYMDRDLEHMTLTLDDGRVVSNE